MGTTVLHGQSLADIAVQQNGTLEAVVSWAFDNGISVTDPLEGGMELTGPIAGDSRPDVVDYYRAYNVRPATAPTDADDDITSGNDPCNLCRCFI